MKSENAVPWKLVGQEAADYRQAAIAKLLAKYNLPIEEIEQDVDLWIASVNEVAAEAGEDVPCLGLLHS